MQPDNALNGVPDEDLVAVNVKREMWAGTELLYDTSKYARSHTGHACDLRRR